MVHDQLLRRFPQNIILVGMMGSGKTTVGKLLAKQLGRTFVDSDEEIQRRTGVSIPHIFDVEGETGFRQRETCVIRELLGHKNIVLATGGGAVTNPLVREALQHDCLVIYLKSSAHDLWQRTRFDNSRPLLQTENPRARIEELLVQRDPLYREVADIIINTGRQNVNTLICQLLEKLSTVDISTLKTGHRNMQTLHVGLADRSYPIHIGRDVFQQAELLLPYIPSRRAVVVSNTTVAPLYLSKLENSLSKHGVSIDSIVIPDGEQYKTLDTLNQIYTDLLTRKSERNTPLIALGGGVVGDITGYAAASYLRGVPFIQIPTTLLSQVDSSVGGKTGVNHKLGKNMIGAFYQPLVVIADTDVLDTLPDNELRAGIAEIIKYGLIRDLPFFEWLEKNIHFLLQRDKDALRYAIARSCHNKAEVVGRDEKESGERALLNLGHTFGHAIENAMGYGVWLHGEAVAAGTVMAADLSMRMGWISPADKERICTLLERSVLPLKSPCLGVDQYLQLMQLDKKVADGKIRFVLLKSIGQAVITADVPVALLSETIRACSE